MFLKELRKDPAATKLLRMTGSEDREISRAAMVQFTSAIEGVIREAILDGDLVTDIFDVIPFPMGVPIEFSTSPVPPGTERDFIAYTHPGHGRIPHQIVEGDYLAVHTYPIASSTGWKLSHAAHARWDEIEKQLVDVLIYGFVKKMNDDGLHTVITSGTNRNIMVNDADAQSGQFTKRLIGLLQVATKRNAGGNSASINRGKLTDLLVSEEGIQEVKNWGVDQLDELSRREVHMAEDTISSLYKVNLRPMVELGQGQEYQKYFLNTLSGSFVGDDVELVVGLDLSQGSSPSFVMPVRKPVTLYNDDSTYLHRAGQAGIYGDAEIGFGQLDNRKVILGCF